MIQLLQPNYKNNYLGTLTKYLKTFADIYCVFALIPTGHIKVL